MATDWFVKSDLDEHEIFLPGRAGRAAREALEGARAEHADREQIARVRSEHASGVQTVELRPLDAGDVADVNEIRLSQAGSSVPLGEAKLLAVERGLVTWSLPQPITRETIRQLNPLVFEQIFELLDMGEGANGSGPPPTPPPAATAQDAETDS